MSEETKPATTSAATETKKDDTVPASTVKDLRDQLDKAQLELLSPEYMAFKESQRKKDEPATKSATSLLGELTPQEIESLPKGKLLQLAVARAEETVTPKIRKEFETRITALQTYVGNLGAFLELEAVKKEFPDFDQYESEVDKLLAESKDSLTFRAAYLQVRGAKQVETKSDDKSKTTKETKTNSAEKPTTTVPHADTAEKKYKTSEEAGNAAWDEVKQKYGITSDTL